jgi:hypothetical protein
MKTIGTLAVLLAVTVLSHPARGQGQSFTAAVDAPAQTWPSVAGVWVDPGALGETAASRQTLPQVAVHEAQKPGAALAARVERIDTAYRVLWQVPPAGKDQSAGTLRHFVIQWGALQPSPMLAATAPNLIYNGGFEDLDSQGRPVAMGVGNFSSQFRVDQEKGNHFLSFNAPATGRHGPVYLTPQVSVEAGKAYTCAFRYRITGAAPGSTTLTFSSTIQFTDGQKQQLPFVRALYSKQSNMAGWQTYNVTITAPKDATLARWSLYNRSTAAYSVAVDDLSIAPAALAEVKSITAADGRRIDLAARSPDIRRFDLGPDKSQVWPGFTALTPSDQYSEAKGFGFTRLGRPKALDTVRPDALTRDFISAADARLRVDLPKGKYKIWLITGDSQVGGTVERFYFDQSIGINGKEIWKSKDTAAGFFGAQGAYWRFYRTVWTPGMDYYDAFVAPHFQTRTFDVEVARDHLDLKWSNLPVNAIVIAPAGQVAAMEREMTALAAQRRRATQITEVPGPVEPMPKTTSEDQKRGFILFRRPANEIIYPSSRPREGEQITELQAFAAPGQAQSVHFSLLPLNDLGALSVTAGDLHSGTSTIAASAVDVRVERYIFHETARLKRTLRGDYHYQIAPFPLDHQASVSGKSGVTWSWWATIRVPEGTPAGVYEGALTIRSGQGEGFNLPLRLRVVPFALAPLPIAQGYYYFPSEPWYSTFWGGNVSGPSYEKDPAVRKIIVEHETRELAFMKELGLNSVAFGDDLRGDVDYVDGVLRLKKDNRLEFWMDLYAKAKMGPMPYYGFISWGNAKHLGNRQPELKTAFSDAWTKAYRSFPPYINQIARQRGWPEILWYVSDEASNDGEKGGQWSLKLAKALEDLPGVRTIASMNGKWEHPMPAHLDISMPNIAFPITDETIAMIHKGGSELWIYNCGDGRLMLGLYPWRIGAKGRFQWTYRSNAANPWDDLDGGYGETAYSISLPGPDGPVPCLPAQTVRAAINDHRYVATLERAIAAAGDQPEKQKTLAQAKQFLADLRRRIPVDARVLVGYKVDPRETGSAVGGEFKNADALDRVRWAAAEFILQLDRK